MDLIVLTGLRGSGKSAVADYLCKNHGYQRRSFATPLKKAAMSMFGLSTWHVTTAEGKAEKIYIDKGFTGAQLSSGLYEIFGITAYDMSHNVYQVDWGMTSHEIMKAFVLKATATFANKEHTVRGILQKLGTEVVRETIGDDVWIKNMEIACRQQDKVVIDDCRFENEAEWAHEMGGRIIHVNRPSVATGDDLSHASEQDMMRWWSSHVDVTLDNTSTLEALYGMVESSVTKQG